MKFSTCSTLALATFAVIASLVDGHADHHQHHHRHLEEIGDRKCGTKIPSKEERAEALEVSRKWASRMADFMDVEVEVFAHVVTNSSGSGVLTMENIMDTIDHLNEAYSGTGFSFVLRGATCTENDLWYSDEKGGEQITAMKTALREGDEKTLNLYFKDFPSGDPLGYAVFPADYENDPIDDGVVMMSNQYAGSDAAPYDEGDTLVHETGHWLGLLHVFYDEHAEATEQYSTFPSFRYCLFGQDNDMVRDTPKSFTPTYGCPTNRVNTCFLRWGPDPISNFMNYGDDACLDEFSAGQIDRMQAQWMEYRASGTAVTTENLPTGDLCPGEP